MKIPYFKDAVAFITDTAKDGCQIFIPIPSLKLKEVYQQQLRDFLNSQSDIEKEIA